MLKKLFSAVLFFTFIVTCQSPIADTSVGDKTFTFQLLHEKLGLDVNVTIAKDGQQIITPEGEKMLKEYLTDRFSDEIQIHSIDDLEVAFFQASEDDVASRKITIVSKAISLAGDTYPIAVEFDPLPNVEKVGGDPVGPYVGGVEHSCTAKPCNCCDFIKEVDGWNIITGYSYKIVGCKCKESPADCATEGGTCVHKISTAP